MKRSRGGFTLIEMVAAVAASAFVFAAGTILVVSSMRMQKQILSDASRVSDARVVLTVIENLASDGAIAPPVHTVNGVTINNTSGATVIIYENRKIYAGASKTDPPLMEDVDFTATVDGLLLKVKITDSNDESFSTSVYCRSWAPELSEIKDSLNTKFSASQTEGNSRYKLISTAFGQLGSTGQIIGDTGSQTFATWYNSNWPDNDVAWCACFVSWCISKQSLTNAPCKAHVDEFADFFKPDKFILPNNAKDSVIPGDLIFFDTKNNDSIADHMGIVLKVDPDNHIVYTIEGNRYDQVAFGTYDLNDPHSAIIGYGQLDWN